MQIYKKKIKIRPYIKKKMPALHKFSEFIAILSDKNAIFATSN